MWSPTEVCTPHSAPSLLHQWLQIRKFGTQGPDVDNNQWPNPWWWWKCGNYIPDFFSPFFYHTPQPHSLLSETIKFLESCHFQLSQNHSRGCTVCAKFGVSTSSSLVLHCIHRVHLLVSIHQCLFWKNHQPKQEKAMVSWNCGKENLFPILNV